MLGLASPIVDTGALVKILVASFAGGAGVAIAFGVALFGISRAQAATADGSKVINYTLAAAAGLFCLLAIVIGVYAMTQKS